MASGRAGPREATTIDRVEQLYARHGPSVLRLCLRFGRTTAWAEDVLHEVFVRLLERREDLDDDGNLAGWLHTVAYRLCLDRLRRERGVWSRVKAAIGAEPAGPARTPETELVLSERARAARAALDRLPPKQRVALVMLHVDGMSQAEIAAVLGHSEGYLSKLLARATRAMQAAGYEVGDA